MLHKEEEAVSYHPVDSGDLLLVRKFDRFDFRIGRLTHSLKVFRLQCAHGNRPNKWRRPRVLEMMLCFPITLHPCLLRKCIYFVADDWEVLLMENLKGLFTGVSSTSKTEERKHTSTASIVQRRTFHHQSILPTIV